MNQYNSYYLYQQFEKRGSQDWIPCYPNIFSVDGDGTMPLVMKKENDPDCGYTGDTEPIYRWYPLPITTDYICDECPAVTYRWENMNPSTDYYCEGTTKYYKQIRQYSYDSGTTWYDVTPPEYQRGSLYQTGSTDCGYVPTIYRWTKTDDVTCVWVENQYRTTTGTPYCEGYDKYVEVYSQVSYDGGITWSTTATTPTLVEAYSQDCGYVPLQRTTTGTPYCTGYDKYVDVYSEISYDNGTTWETTATTTTLVEQDSEDCGWTPPEVIAKYYITDTTNPTPIGFNQYTTGFSAIEIDGVVQQSVVSAYTFSTTGEHTVKYTLTDNTKVPQNAYRQCYNLVELRLPNTVTSTSSRICYGCIGLTTLELSNTLGSLGGGAFSGCTSLTSVTIPDSVTSISPSVFSNCTSLTSITCLATVPPTITDGGGSAYFPFENTNNCPIYVPAESVETYKSEYGWSSYSSRIQAITQV